MDEALHPSTLSEILDRTIQIYRRRFLVFLGLAAVPYAAILVPVCGLLLLGIWMGGAGTGADSSLRIGLLAAVGVLVCAPVWVGATALSTGGLTHAAAHRCFDDPVTIRGAWKEAWARGWGYTWLYLLEVLLIWVAPVFVWFLLVMGTAAIAALARNMVGAAAGVLAGLMSILLVAGLAAYGIWMLLRLALAFPACVVERAGVGEALRRGPALSRGTRGRIFLLYLLGAILNYLLLLAITIPIGIALALIPALQGPQHAATASTVAFVAIYGMGLAAQALTKPVYSIALVLFYFDQRIRQEGFDIEWMMMRAGLTAPATPAPQMQPWMPAQATAGSAATAADEELKPAGSVLPVAGAAGAAASGEPL